MTGRAAHLCGHVSGQVQSRAGTTPDGPDGFRARIRERVKYSFCRVRVSRVYVRYYPSAPVRLVRAHLAGAYTRPLTCPYQSARASPISIYVIEDKEMRMKLDVFRVLGLVL